MLRQINIYFTLNTVILNDYLDGNLCCWRKHIIGVISLINTNPILMLCLALILTVIPYGKNVLIK